MHGLGSAAEFSAEAESADWYEAADMVREEPEGASKAVHLLDTAPEEVLRRIQSCTLWFINELRHGKLPVVEFTLHAPTYAAAAHDCDNNDGWGAEQLLTQTMQQKTVKRSLVGRHPESADAVARLFVVLEAVHALVLAAEHVTQRELWYRLKTHEVFRSPRDVIEAVQDAVNLLQVPRSLLNITASSKGLVAGRLIIHDQQAGTETDCSTTGSCGQQIPGNIQHITRNYAYQTDAHVILVIEKDAVFQLLVALKFFERMPCILVTGKGVPDMATRAFLSCLTTAFPALPVMALVDWNPAGVGILSIYKFGSRRMGLESPRYALPGLAWLGARSSMLRYAVAEAFQSLTGRDHAMAEALTARLQAVCPAWAAELGHMRCSGSKAEIEALYTVRGAEPADFAALLLECLQAGDFV